MKTQLRHLIAEALYPTKAHSLPSVCERYGLETGTPEEAFSSKRSYVLHRLEKLSDEKVLGVAKQVVEDFPDDKLVKAVEHILREGRLITDLTRKHLTEALDEFPLAGKGDLIELIRKHRPSIEQDGSLINTFGSIADDLRLHAVATSAWSNSQSLKHVGFFEWSQTKLFAFLADLLHPIRRSSEEQEKIVAKLNPVLRRDGYFLVQDTPISGYPSYKVTEAVVGGLQPADLLISQTLISYDENGVHQSWEKALARRATYPEGAITAAKTLLETVCKHIIEGAGGEYGKNDDLPKLYNIAAENLNLAPSQHTEAVFKAILGNCHSVVSNLSGLRNKLGDSHGQGKHHVRPLPRHAELAVNLAGSIAMFLIATWNARKK